MAKVVIKRDRGWADSLRKYKVIVDEKEIGRIKQGKSIEVEVNSGQHEIYCKIDWCRSNKIVFNINNENEVKSFEVKSSLRGFKVILAIFYAIFLWHKWLKLEET